MIFLLAHIFSTLDPAPASSIDTAPVDTVKHEDAQTTRQTWGTHDKPMIPALNKYCVELQRAMRECEFKTDEDYEFFFWLEDEMEYWQTHFTLILPL